MVNVNQGDILIINFDPSLGHEQKGNRPAIILSTRVISQYSNMYIVAPISSTKRDYPAYYQLATAEHTSGKVLLDQTTALDLSSRRFRVVDKVTKEELTSINHRYKLFFDIDY